MRGVVQEVIRRLVFPMLMMSIVGGLWFTAERKAVQEDMNRQLAEMALPGIDQRVAVLAEPVWLVSDDSNTESLYDPT